MTDRFELFWAAYPRKTGKGAARKVWTKLAPDAALVDAMLAALAWQVGQPQWLKDGGQFIPMPRTYLAQERWLDEPQKPMAASAGKQSVAVEQQQKTQELHRLMAEGVSRPDALKRAGF